MKPSKLIPLAVIMIALGLTWLCAVFFDAGWVLHHVPSLLVAGIITFASLLMIVGGFILIASYYE